MAANPPLSPIPNPELQALVRDYFRPSPTTIDLDPAEPAVPLSHYLWILRRHRWKIAAFVAFCLAATAIISSRLTPIYESTATIDVDRRLPTGILGQEALQSSTDDADQFLATQVKLIQSDSVLRPVARRYKLREPKKGAEETSTLPAAEFEETPVLLERLKVTRPPNTYLLLISYRSPDRKLAADVANATAQSYLEHTYNIRYRASAGLSAFMEKQIEELRAKMERSSGALATFERELNVINPEERTNILSARLLQLNTEFTNAQSDRVTKEAAFNAVASGSLDAALASSQGEPLRKLAEALTSPISRWSILALTTAPITPSSDAPRPGSPKPSVKSTVRGNPFAPASRSNTVPPSTVNPSSTM